MCGIAGWNGDVALAPEEVLALLRHRGPNQKGSFNEDRVYLLYIRLSILDLSPQGSQPMHSDDKQYVLVFNGEIYNHPELRAELQQQGRSFRSTSYTETLLYALATLCAACLLHLNGIFAFAFYDRQEQRLLLARDQFGVKPLYYVGTEKGFVFASELKSVIRSLAAPTPMRGN
jgi:asparagine synthase (glutamine-hydrolysing)